MKINVYFMTVVFFSCISTMWRTSYQVCGTCYSVEVPLTGFLSVDAANIGATGGTMLRKPNLDEFFTNQ
jgi:hypothetical protein